ncbi:ATP-binding protein [Pyrococcus kukulkanii]|uniref:ATP-binding protein n=1 Tax=Pyrococcus kukulkanii TaxID=1609559 RepID=UPI00356B56E7
MNIVRFIDREREINELNKAKERARRGLYVLVIYGHRRVGKTRLLAEFLGKNDLYFFVNRSKNSERLLKEFTEILREKQFLGKYEVIETWDQFFDVLLSRCEGVVAFDEFQDFTFVDRSVFSTLQKKIDEFEDKAKVLLILTGSTLGLIKRTFQDGREPLYGRVKKFMKLKPLGIREAYRLSLELKIENIADFITLYSVFGGYPKYWVAIEDEGLISESAEKILKELIFSEFPPLENEAEIILSLELGGRSSTYYSILQAIAEGKSTISQIASHLRRKETSITRQLNELREYFELVGKTCSPINERCLLYVAHPYLAFWFRFIYPNQSEYEINREKLWRKVKKDLEGYVGNRFDLIGAEILTLKYQVSKFGKHFGFYREEGKRKVYGIDFVGIDGRKAIFAEFKWRKKAIDAEKLVEELKWKAEMSGWKGEKKFVLVGRKFKNVPGDVEVIGEEDIMELISQA